MLIQTRVSNGTGQCNFSGHRDKENVLVPGQRDNGTSSKYWHGTGWGGKVCQNPGRDTGLDNRFFSLKFSVLQHFFLL